MSGVRSHDCTEVGAARSKRYLDCKVIHNWPRFFFLRNAGPPWDDLANDVKDALNDDDKKTRTLPRLSA